MRNKVYIIGNNPELLQIIQRELFEQGYKWGAGRSTEQRSRTEVIYCKENGVLTFSTIEDMHLCALNGEIINLSGWRCFKHGALQLPTDKDSDDTGELVWSNELHAELFTDIYRSIGPNDIWMGCNNLPNPEHLLIGQKIPDARLKEIEEIQAEIDRWQKKIDQMKAEIEKDSEG